MYETLKYIWLCLTIFLVCALIAFLPFDRWQKAYMDEYYRIKNEPQRRIEATYKFIEEVEDGKIDISKGIDFETYLSKITPKKNVKVSAKTSVKPYQKPLYVRDKYNPKVLHPYREK